MKTVTAEQLKNMQQQDEDFLLINTLDEEQFSETRIPGSINIPQKRDDFVQRVEEQAGGKQKKIVVYCASKQCDSSPTAAKKLEEAGFTDVLDFEAGARGWQEAGEPLQVPSG